jgi:hypothetical protein
VLKSRFEVFTALSLALHLGVFAAAFARRTQPVRPDAGAGAGSSAAGQGAAAIPGETFEVPEMESAEEESAGGPESAPTEVDGPTAPPQASGDLPSARKAHGSRGKLSRSPPEAASEVPPPAYGAVGDRTAGDLVTTFKRVFPIAASSDPLWDHVPVGFFAEGEVTFFLAEDGSLTHATASASAAPAFRAAIQRTTALLKHRLFTARGATTHLHMVVRVSDHLLNHGAFTIDAAGSFELPSGRHVSVSIVER